jgi:hypothetical protein
MCIYERWVARRIRELWVTFGDECRDGKEGEMLQAPTATARTRRGDELVVGRARRTTATITQPGITVLERHFENLKVLGIRLGALIGADLGSRGGAGYPSPSTRHRRKVYWYYGYHVSVSSEVPLRWGAETDRSLGEPGAEIPEVVGERRQEVPRPGATLRCSLSQEGNADPVRTVDWFDPERGLRFSTYATWWICQGVQRGLRDRGRAIRLPLHEEETVSPRPTPPARRSPPNSDATLAPESLQYASARG